MNNFVHFSMTPVKRKLGLQAAERGTFKKVKKEDDEKVKEEEEEEEDTEVKKEEDAELKEEKDVEVQDKRKIAEVETDSDPIVESSTASKSGDDDGVSWPSDDEAAGEEQGYDDKENEIEGPVEVTNVDRRTEKPKAKDEGGKGNSRESHIKQKATAQERKAAKPNADSLARSKKLWERLRRKSHVPLEERKTLIAELFDIITGRVKDFVFKHDSVRVIQTALKYANLDQNKMIARELKGEYKNLAESKYAKFLVGKLLVCGDKEIRDMVIPEFYGNVRRMIKHPEASWILDDVYRGAATPSQKAALLREWYGAEFALFRSNGEGITTAELKEVLAVSPEKKKPIMRSLHDLINLMVQKKTTGFTMLHDAMLQYYLNLLPGSEEAAEFVELLKGDEEGDLLKNIAFTKSGAHIVCLALAHSSAKDRKHMLRPYKNMIQMMAYDSHAHQILLTAYDVIDDTVLTSKSIFPELLGKTPESESQQQELLSALNHMTARIPLLYLFSGKSKAILPTDDLKLLDEVHQIRTTTSKKDPATRRKELISHLSAPLLALIKNHATNLVATSFGCQFITEVLLNATGDRQAAVDALVAVTQADSEIKERLNTAAAGRMLKILVQGGHFNPVSKKVEEVDPPLDFHNSLYATISDEIVEWATGDKSFVVVALLEAPGFSSIERLEKELNKERPRLEEAAKAGVKHPEPTGGIKGGNAKKHKGIAKGNAGARILLEKLDAH